MLTNEQIADYLDENAVFKNCVAEGNVWEFPSIPAAMAAMNRIGHKASSWNWNSWEGKDSWAQSLWNGQKPTILVRS